MRPAAAIIPVSGAPGGLGGEHRREVPACLHPSAAAILPGSGAPGGVGGEHLREFSACLQLLVAAALPGGGASGGLCDENLQLVGAATLPGGGAPGGLRGAYFPDSVAVCYEGNATGEAAMPGSEAVFLPACSDCLFTRAAPPGFAHSAL